MLEPPQAGESLADQAYARIKAAIVSCRLAPSERVTERMLANRFGFGLSPIRKALLRLDNEGLVTTRPRSGYRVAPLSVEDVDNLFDVWTVIGSAVIRRAAARWTQEDRDELTQAVATLRGDQRKAEVKAPDAAAEIGRLLWQAYCRLAGNSRLTEIWERLDADLQRVFVIGGWESPEGAEFFLERLAGAPLGDWSAEEWVEGFLLYNERVRQHVVETLQRSESLRTHEITLGGVPED